MEVSICVIHCSPAHYCLSAMSFLVYTHYTLHRITVEVLGKSIVFKIVVLGKKLTFFIISMIKNGIINYRLIVLFMGKKNNKKNVFITMNLHHLYRKIFALKKHKYAQITFSYDD